MRLRRTCAELWPRRGFTAVLLVAHWGAGCTGLLGEPLDVPGPELVLEDEAELVCEGLWAPRHRLMHLTGDQYERTVSDLLQQPTQLTAGFPADERVAGFPAPSQVDTTLARGWWNAASTAATMLEASLDEHVARFAACELAEGSSCVARFIAAFGRRVFRRPLAAEEEQDYAALFAESVADGNDAASSVGAVAQAMLLSPSFLFRVETAPAPNEVRALDHYELASRLSFFLWDAAPDAELLAAAEAGLATNEAVLRQQVDRMLQHPRARASARGFVDNWLQLGELERAHVAPELVGDASMEEMRAALRAQVTSYFEDLVFERQGDYHQLMTSTDYPTNHVLAPVLGVEASGEAWASQPTPHGQRVGVLTLPGVLAAHGGLYAGGTSPIKRGVWLMDRVLCLPHPAPLPQLPDYCNDRCVDGCAAGSTCFDGACVANDAPACAEDVDCGGSGRVCHASGYCIADPDFCIPNRRLHQTTRQWWDSFGSSCHGCHQTINGLGYALEHYDGLGRYRTVETTSEGPEQVDARGLLSLPGHELAEFYGAQGLVDALLALGAGPACYVDSWFVRAYGQIPAEHHGASCTVQSLNEVFRAQDYHLLGLLRAISLSPEFRHSDGRE